MEVIVKQVTSWERVVDATRMTVDKGPLGKEPSDNFKRKILMAEHSPIRLLEFDITLKDIPHFVAMHLVRHKHGFEPFVATQREDRTGVPRNERKQTDLVNCQISLNAQALINVSRKRLCQCADKDTIKVWNAVREEVKKIDPIVASQMVPNCIYRGFCPEIQGCGFAKSGQFSRSLALYRAQNETA